MNFGWPAGALDAVGGITDLLGRLPEIERGISEAGTRVQSTLEEILSTVRPIEDELGDLRETARALDRRLALLDSRLGTLQGLIDPLEQRFLELTESANRLDGALVHVLDRVPGLSPGDARERAEAPK